MTLKFRLCYWTKVSKLTYAPEYIGTFSGFVLRDCKNPKDALEIKTPVACSFKIVRRVRMQHTCACSHCCVSQH